MRIGAGVRVGSGLLGGLRILVDGMPVAEANAITLNISQTLGNSAVTIPVPGDENG